MPLSVPLEDCCSLDVVAPPRMLEFPLLSILVPPLLLSVLDEPVSERRLPVELVALRSVLLEVLSPLELFRSVRVDSVSLRELVALPSGRYMDTELRSEREVPGLDDSLNSRTSTRRPVLRSISLREGPP